MATVSTTQATKGQQKQISRLIEEVGEDALKKLGLGKEDAQRLLARGGEFKQELGKALAPLVQRFSNAPNIIVVPDLAAVELTALVKRELNLTFLDGEYARWDYYTAHDGTPISGRGKRFEVLVWKPELRSDQAISSEAVRKHFRDLGYFGHAGAFTQWRRTCGLEGYYASIPEDSACWRSSDGRLCAPYSIFLGGPRKLSRSWIRDDWGVRWSFVAFREVS
jgi:hypothetical protein